MPERLLPDTRSRTTRSDPRAIASRQVSPSRSRCSCRPSRRRSPARSTARMARSRTLDHRHQRRDHVLRRGRSGHGSLVNEQQRHHDVYDADGRRTGTVTPSPNGQMT